jgi:hypothetical protein
MRRLSLGNEAIGFIVVMPVLWITLCLSTQSLPAATPVAWWSFDEPDALGRDWAGTNDAALVGSPTACAGVRNGAILLNGAGDYLRAETSPDLEITGPMTILLWANANAVNANYPLVSKAASTDNGQVAYMLDLNWANSGFFPTFGVSPDGGYWSGGCRNVASTNALSTGQWHLIGGVYDGTNLMVYVDGQLEASLAYAAGIFPGQDPLFIGWNWSSQWTGTWNGALDEVRVFDVALSAGEILAEFQSAAPPLYSPSSGLLGRVVVGQSRTNQVILMNRGTNDLNVAPLQVGGADAAYFQVLSPSTGFVLPPGPTNAVAVLVRFAPDATRTYDAQLTISSSANSIVLPLAGQGVNNKTFTLDLQRRDPSGRITVTPTTFQGSQMAVIVVDLWDSHPDSEMASRTDALVPRLNQALDAARDLGISVIFCPSDLLNQYAGTPYRINIVNLPYHAQGDNGFNPPLPPYRDADWFNMEPLGKSVPAYPNWTQQHPDLVMKPGDLVSLNRQEIFNYGAENGISNLVYMGVAANVCLCCAREFSMIPMKRYCNLEPILVRDLTESETLNGRSPTNYSVVDLTMTPDRGHREVTAHNETYLCSTVSAAQLMQQWVPAAYSCLVSANTNLLCYWRLESKSGYRDNLDVQRVQTCWWYNQTNGLGFNVPGAIVSDTNTALQFKGSTTVLVSPTYRDDIPTNSPLVSLSATNFTLEVWVQVAALNSNQWFFSHDNSLANGVDVLLGLNENNHFQFMVGTDGPHTGSGDVLQSATEVMPTDVASNRWFHLVATHDLDHSAVALYVNGNLDGQGAHVCQPVGLAAAPHLGSRGLVTVDATGKLSEPGFQFLRGTLDEVAIYAAALDGEVIRRHYLTGRGLPVPLLVRGDDARRPYGATNPVFGGTITGLQNGDNITASYSTIADTNSPVGAYSIVPVLNDPDQRLTNYNLTISNGTLTITPAALTVTADFKSRVYGTTNPVLTGTVLGLQNGDSIAATYATTADTASGVGGYPITITLEDPDQKLGNYAVTLTEGTLRVRRASLTGVADAKSRFCGANNPPFTATYSGFVDGEDASVVKGILKGSTPATTNSPVGTYPISVQGQSAPNYAIQYMDGTLTVLPAPGLLSVRKEGDQIVLSWPAFGSALRLQASDNLLPTQSQCLSPPDWQYLDAQVLESNGMNWAILPASNSSHFFRLGSP